MNHYIVAVKDRAIDAFMRPFTVPHRNAAIRGFTDEVNRKDSEMHRHPEDYDLYVLAQWDDNTGKVTPQDPELVARAQDLIERT